MNIIDTNIIGYCAHDGAFDKTKKSHGKFYGIFLYTNKDIVVKNYSRKHIYEVTAKGRILDIDELVPDDFSFLKIKPSKKSLGIGRSFIYLQAACMFPEVKDLIKTNILDKVDIILYTSPQCHSISKEICILNSGTIISYKTIE